MHYCVSDRPKFENGKQIKPVEIQCMYVCFRYVRQGVLYGLGMLIAATPAHTLLGELSTGLMEGVAWMKEVLSEDADEQSRMLAGHALTLLNTAMKES